MNCADTVTWERLCTFCIAAVKTTQPKELYAVWRDSLYLLSHGEARSAVGQPSGDRQTAIRHYRTAMAVFCTWRAKGVISKGDLQILEEEMAQKYRFPSASIYRDGA
jgi:hypothetical protein